jgi:hypothetical protein
VEVISDGENRLAGRGGRHGERLEAFVIGKAAGDGCRPNAPDFTSTRCAVSGYLRAPDS